MNFDVISTEVSRKHRSSTFVVPHQIQLGSIDMQDVASWQKQTRKSIFALHQHTSLPNDHIPWYKKCVSLNKITAFLCCFTIWFVTGLEPVLIRNWTIQENVILNPLWFNLLTECCKLLFTLCIWLGLNKFNFQTKSWSANTNLIQMMKWNDSTYWKQLPWILIILSSVLKCVSDMCLIVGMYSLSSAVQISMLEIVSLLVSGILQCLVLHQFPTLAEIATLIQLTICSVTWCLLSSTDANIDSNSGVGPWSSGSTWVTCGMIASGCFDVLMQRCNPVQAQKQYQGSCLDVDAWKDKLLPFIMVILQFLIVVWCFILWIIFTPLQSWPIQWYGWTGTGGWSMFIILYLFLIMARGVAVFMSAVFVTPLSRMLCLMLAVVVTTLAEIIWINTHFSTVQYLLILLLCFTGIQYVTLATQNYDSNN